MKQRRSDGSLTPGACGGDSGTTFHCGWCRWSLVLHTILIGLHALAGTVALAAGAAALRGGRLFPTYLAAMLAMLGFLVLAVAVEWGELAPQARVLFSALLLLGAVMCRRSWLARRLLPVAPAPPTAPYVRRHVGFTLVGLLDAFVVISVLNAGGPGWSVFAAGAAVALAGHVVLGTVEQRLVGHPLPA